MRLCPKKSSSWEAKIPFKGLLVNPASDSFWIFLSASNALLFFLYELFHPKSGQYPKMILEYFSKPWPLLWSRISHSKGLSQIFIWPFLFIKAVFRISLWLVRICYYHFTRSNLLKKLSLANFLKSVPVEVLDSGSKTVILFESKICTSTITPIFLLHNDNRGCIWKIRFP